MSQMLCSACQSPITFDETICSHCGLVIASSPPANAMTHTSTTATVLQPGQQLANGVYTIQHLLSKGGMGSIYLATDRQAFDRVVVIKAMIDYFDPNDLHQFQAAQQRFLAEAQTLATLRHPAIPQIYNYFQDGSHNYIVMEYIEGCDLETGLTHTDPHTGVTIAGNAYPQNQVLQWGIAICRVLEYLANREPHPVVHHDIKPANLLLDHHSGDIRLVDFGTAKTRLISQVGGGVGLQKTSVYGTLGYAAPEQYRGESDPRSDVYALAATLYHLATDDDPGTHPFSFPKLDDLGVFGELLSKALADTIDQRPTAATLRQQFKRLHDGMEQLSIITPDGLNVINLHELVQWCLAHWDEARTWLYAGLPQQIEVRWGDTQTARMLRDTRSAHHNQDVGLDTMLRLLDPALPPAQIAFHPISIDFGTVVLNDPIQQHVHVINHGPGYAEIRLIAPPWVVPPAQIALPPGASTSIMIALQLREQQSLGLFDDVLIVQMQHGSTSHIPITAQAILCSPDGKELTSLKELVSWCEANWSSALSWLHKRGDRALITQIKPLTTGILTESHRPLLSYLTSGMKGLDALLELFDPYDFGVASPNLMVSPETIDLHTLRKAPQTLTLKNISRRYITVEVELPRWVSSDVAMTELAPGEERQLRVSFNHVKIPLRKLQKTQIVMRHESTHLASVRIVGQMSVIQRLWLYHPHLFLLILVLSVLLLGAAANFAYTAVDHARHYQTGVAALEANDYTTARQELSETLAGREEYRDAQTLLRESYYRPFMQAVETEQWDVAAEQAVRLEAIAPYYRNTPTIIDTTPELANRMMALRWQQGYVQQVATNLAATSGHFVLDGQAFLYQYEDDLVIEHLDTGNQQRLPNDDYAFYNSAQVSADGDNILVKPFSDTAQIWHISTDTVFTVDTSHANMVFSPDSQYIYEQLGTTLWRTNDGEIAQGFDEHRIVDMDANGQILITANDEDTLDLWRQTGQADKPFERSHTIMEGENIARGTFSPSGQLMAVVTDAGNISVWDRATLLAGEAQPVPLYTVAADTENISDIRFSPDDMVIAANISNIATFWMATNGERIQLPERIYDYVFDSQNGTLIALSRDQAFMIDTQSGEVRRTIGDDITMSYNKIALSPDGQVLATNSNSVGIMLWRVADGAKLQLLANDTTEDHTNVGDITFSPDGRTLAVTDNASVTLWRAQPPMD